MADDDNKPADLGARRAERDAGGSDPPAMTEDEAAEQAAVGDDSEKVVSGDDGQLYVWERGRKVTLGSLISRGTPVEYAFVFGGKRLKGDGQLIPFDEDVLSVTRGLVGHTKLVPKRDDDENVKKVTVEVQIRPKSVVPADSAQAIELLGGYFEKRGWTPPPARADAA